VVESSVEAARHAVTFYRDAAQLAGDVAHFLSQGLAAGTPAVVVATPEHRRLFAEQLGSAYEEALASGRYIELDAAETLAQFMIDGAPEPIRFRTVIGGVLSAAARDGRQVRVYGEMVALLWDDGDVAAALALEALWNDFGARHDFLLLCAYPAADVATGSLVDATQVCRLHDAVAVRGDVAAESELLFPVPSAVPAVRRFVTETLDGQDVGLVEDAALVATELASNAVRHARTAFRVNVHVTGHAVRIEAEDGERSGPQPRHPTVRDTTGRGLHLLGRVAPRWGWDTLPTGKVVWAEFDVG
jgi:hypothetical protein